MARAHFADVLIGTSGTGALSLLDGAAVHVYDQGTTNHIAQTLYAADSGGTTIANPLTSDANGKVEFWLDTPARVDLAASKTGFSPSTRTVDVEAAPSGGGSGVLTRTPFTLSAAQIANLHTTPVAIVPAQGAGVAIGALSISNRFVPGSTPYTATGVPVLKVGWPGELATELGSLSYGGAVANAASLDFFPSLQSFGGDPTPYDNQPLFLWIDSGNSLVDGDGTIAGFVLWTPA